MSQSNAGSLSHGHMTARNIRGVSLTRGHCRLVTWLCCHMTAWSHDCVVTWLRGHMTVLSHNCVVTRLRKVKVDHCTRKLLPELSQLSPSIHYQLTVMTSACWPWTLLADLDLCLLTLISTCWPWPLLADLDLCWRDWCVVHVADWLSPWQRLMVVGGA
jgi:hypothetical protein